MNLIYKTEFGSKLYGTSLIGSDTDYKGLFLPELKELILAKAPKHFTNNTSDSNVKNTENDVDESWLSVQQFFKNLSQADTNAVSILFSPHSSHQNKEGSHIEWLKNLDHTRLLSKNLAGMAGFVVAQAHKYTIKGEKLKVLEAFYESYKLYGKDGLLREWVENNLKEFLYKHTNAEKYISLENLLSTDYLVVNNKKLPLDKDFIYHEPTLNKILRGFGERAKQTSLEGADLKSIYHSLRILEELRLLHTEGEFSYPLPNTDFLLAVRQHKFKTEELFFFLEYGLDQLNKYKENSILGSSVDYKYIDETILNLYNFHNLGEKK